VHEILVRGLGEVLRARAEDVDGRLEAVAAPDERPVIRLGDRHDGAGVKLAGEREDLLAPGGIGRPRLELPGAGAEAAVGGQAVRAAADRQHRQAAARQASDGPQAHLGVADDGQDAPLARQSG
jgi:hypothetical protein